MCKNAKKTNMNQTNVSCKSIRYILELCFLLGIRLHDDRLQIKFNMITIIHTL